MSKSQRRQWTNFFSSGKNKFGLDLLDPESRKTNRPALERRALQPQKPVLFCHVVTEELDGETVYKANTGAHMIVGDGHVTIKLPYGISTNDIWRATIENGKQRNSLSMNAKTFKRNVYNQYAPMLSQIKWHAINKLCEVRLVVQPPIKVKQYSAATYPRFDIDNYPKLLIDSLKGMGLLYKDDGIFISEKIEFARPVDGGCIWLSCVFIEETNWLEKEVDFNWLAGRVA